ncbi:hypothetical protein F4212_02545 [Candidatus Poribacteria bacterium]|nr:hypothetical protein [Candidatus Poribacteria bacterium]
MSEVESNRRFVREALPLLSSYLYSEQVELEPIKLQVGNEDEDEYQEFADLLRMRHALACGQTLKPIIEAIKRGVSQSSEIVRAESKGAIFGRLDIPLYLNSRGTNLSWPRAFPVLIAKATANTPENQLVVDTLRQLVRRLNATGNLEASAERSNCISLMRWGREQLHSVPWNRVIPVQIAERLYLESENRLRKRQTGNEPAYGRFLDWYKQWSFDASRSSPDELENLVDLILAFPSASFFYDRVFEIWCLHKLIESFRRCGAVITDGPRPLLERLNRPIYAINYEGYKSNIWFQKALPTSEARWAYVESKRSLIGIPDITVIGSDGRRLLIDAKRREVRSPTRSEETYKMLGYLENFRNLFQKTPFCGALCFLSSTDLFTEVAADGNHRIVLIGAHTNNPKICAFGGRMDTLVSEWLSQRQFNDTFEGISVPNQLM